MKVGPRQRTQLHVAPPTGVSTQLYVSVDKNQQQISTEVCTKKVSELVRAQVGTRHGPVDAARREGVVFLNWEPLVHLVPALSGSLSLRWNPVLLASTQLDKDLISRSMEETSAGNGSGKGAQLRASMEGIAWVN